VTLRDLKKAIAGGAELTAIVYAADPMVYLLQVSRADDSAGSLPLTLQNAQGENLVYRSRHAANQALARAGAKEVMLVHESAYGEMVGLPASGENRLEHRHPIKLDDL